MRVHGQALLLGLALFTTYYLYMPVIYYFSTDLYIYDWLKLVISCVVNQGTMEPQTLETQRWSICNYKQLNS